MKGVKVIFVMESTGLHCYNLAIFHYSQKQLVSLVLANKMKEYYKNLNNKTKTDKVDSKVITRYSIERSVEY